MALNNLYKSAITTNVGNMINSNPADVISTRLNLKRLKYYNNDIDRPYIDKDLDASIKNFQQDKKLKIDGIINPDGETERAMNTELRKLSESGDNDMPAEPAPEVESEPLDPPSYDKETIPGTKIPDEGLPEDDTHRPNLIDPELLMDPHIIITPPSVDNGMLVIDPNSVRNGKGWKI